MESRQLGAKHTLRSLQEAASNLWDFSSGMEAAVTSLPQQPGVSARGASRVPSGTANSAGMTDMGVLAHDQPVSRRLVLQPWLRGAALAGQHPAVHQQLADMRAGTPFMWPGGFPTDLPDFRAYGTGCLVGGTMVATLEPRNEASGEV